MLCESRTVPARANVLAAVVDVGAVGVLVVPPPQLLIKTAESTVTIFLTTHFPNSLIHERRAHGHPQKHG